VVFFYAYSFYVEPIPALRYTLFCPALFSMDRKGFLQSLLRSRKTYSRPAIGFR
jgi:hypothetical protein